MLTLQDGNYDSDSNKYVWRQPGIRSNRSLPDLWNGKEIDLSPYEYPEGEKPPDFEKYTPPSRYLLWLHASVAKVYHAAGAGEIDLEYHRDIGPIAVNASNEELLTHAVWEIFQQEMDGVECDDSCDDDDDDDDGWSEYDEPVINVSYGPSMMHVMTKSL